MRPLFIFVVITLFCIVNGKLSQKNFSESMGQEVIEIEGPKELPPGLEEEPSADLDDDDDEQQGSESKASAIITKKEARKTTALPDVRRKIKDIGKIDGVTPEDEEAKLEKELAEIYKDTDYKEIEESTETKERVTSTDFTEDTSRPIGRQRNNFKFAPDSTNKKDVEKFRTSLDDINCKNRQELKATVDPSQTDSSSLSHKIKAGNALISMFLMCLNLITCI